MQAEALISEVFAEVLGRIVSEQEKRFEQIVALRDAEFKSFQAQCEIAVRTALDRLTNGKDGEPGLRGEIGPQGEPGPQGLQGLQGKDGKDGIDGQPGEPGPQGPIGPPGSVGPEGPHGQIGCEGPMGLKGERGPPGPEGPAGRDGRDGLPGVPGVPGERGTDGKNGVDGKDGAGFDTWEMSYDGERGITFSCSSGDRVKEKKIYLPIPIYRGKWAPGSYVRGDEVTHGGQVYRAIKDTDTKPSTSDDWCIATNRGRDGRDGKDGASGPQGKEGQPGRDLTQLGPDGKKW